MAATGALLDALRPLRAVGAAAAAATKNVKKPTMNVLQERGQALPPGEMALDSVGYGKTFFAKLGPMLHPFFRLIGGGDLQT